MQAAQLQSDKGEKASSGENGDKEILSLLQEAYHAQRNQITGLIRRERDSYGRSKEKEQRRKGAESRIQKDHLAG
jgi:hypothetical protein